MTGVSTNFFSKLQHQESPLAALTSFLERELRYEQAQQIDCL